MSTKDWQAKARGLAPPGKLKQAVPGAVFTVNDKLVVLPEERIPGAKPRTWHHNRRVIVVQAWELVRSASPRTLLVVPCSSSGRVGPADVAIPKGENGFDEDTVVAYTSLVQPLLKSELDQHKGDVSPATLAALRAAIARLLEPHKESRFPDPGDK